MTLFTLAIVLICIWSLAFYGREILRETVQRSFGEQQSLSASFVAAGVNHELDDRLKALEAIAGIITPAILGSATALQTALDDRPVFQRLFAGRTFTVKLNGLTTASAALRAEGIDASLVDADCVATALKGAAAFCRPAVGKKTLAPMAGMAVPIRDVHGKVIGALGGVIDLSKSDFLNKATGNNSDKASGYLVVSPQHRLIVSAKDKNRIMETLPAPGADPAIDRLIRGTGAAGVVVNSLGAEALASSQRIPLANWFVVLTVPAEQTLVPFHAAGRRMLLATLLLSLLAAGLTWLMLRCQLAPMLTAVKTLAAHLKMDQFLQPLAIRRLDEIGELIAGFNRLLEALKQRQEALAVSEERFRCLSEMSADFYWENDSNHRLIHRVESKKELDESVLRHISTLGLRRWDTPSVFPDAAGWQSHRETLDAHLPFRHFEIARMRDDGSVYHVRISGDPLFDDAGQFKGYCGVGSDITERKQIELALVASEMRLSAVLDGVQSAVVTITEHGLVESFNQSAVQMFGYSPDEVVGNNIKMLMPEPYRNEHDSYLDNFKRTGIKKVIGRRREVMGRRKDGSTFPIELGVFETSLNEHKFFIGSISDISFRKQAEAELRIAATAFETQQGMLITDANGVILRVNQAFTEINGYTSAEVVGQTPRLLKSDRQSPDFYRKMWQTIDRTGSWQGEIWDRRKDGEVYPKWLTITAVKDDSGVITHYVGTHLDITERKLTEERLRQLAFYDPLTDLPNRRLLKDRLKESIAVSKRSACHGALMFLDLDNFKSLNDAHGHAVGDLLLIEAAHRLQNCVRQVDTVARFGGDEFVVMLSHLNADRHVSENWTRMVAEKIRASLSEPYLLKIMGDGKEALTIEHCCTVSIGVTLFMGDEASQDELLKRTDMAMYQAKQGGKNSIQIETADI